MLIELRDLKNHIVEITSIPGMFVDILWSRIKWKNDSPTFVENFMLDILITKLEINPIIITVDNCE